MIPPGSLPPVVRRHRGGVIGWVVGALVFCAALAVLAWMLLLPSAVQSRFAAHTGGAELRVQGLMGDPFSGRATVTSWALRASDAPDAPVLARGGSAEAVAANWRNVLDGGDSDTPVVFDSITLHAAELVLTPDAKGNWPLLSLGAAAGLPYERGGKIGDGPRLRVKRLRLTVDTVVIRDAATQRDVAVPVAWRGEFRDLDHSRPVVAALLAAAAGKAPAP